MTLPDVLITSYLRVYPEEFKPAFVTDDRMRVAPLHAPDVRYYRFMYNTVGEKWNWTDRLLLEDSEIRAILSDPCLTIFVLYFNGAPAGYIELAERGGGATEVVYFGLREAYWGKGLGKHLLSFGVSHAFDSGASEVILNTCNLDGPHALKNYQKRGFHVYDVTRKPMPDKEYVKLTAQQKGMY